MSEIGFYISHGTKALEVHVYIVVLWEVFKFYFANEINMLCVRHDTGSLRLAADTGVFRLGSFPNSHGRGCGPWGRSLSCMVLSPLEPSLFKKERIMSEGLSLLWVEAYWKNNFSTSGSCIQVRLI